jgi:hypothetical protein
LAEARVGQGLKRRARKCPICAEPYHPFQSTQRCCLRFACAIAMGKRLEARAGERRARVDRLDRATRLEALKSIGVLIEEAQTAFNAFIRARDERAGYPCISCGVHNPVKLRGGQWDAGHYLSVGSHPELRFDERNAHRQCKKCNGGAGYRFGRTTRTVSVEYRSRLIERIGEPAVLELEGPHPPKRYRHADLREIRAHYRRRRREVSQTSALSTSG